MDPWAAEFGQYLWEEGRGRDGILKIRKYIKLVVASPRLFYLLLALLAKPGKEERKEKSSIYEYYCLLIVQPK